MIKVFSFLAPLMLFLPVPLQAQMTPFSQWAIPCAATPWGAIPPGFAGTAYSSSTPAGLCSSFSETRTCGAQGVLSGSYTAATCTNGCVGTPWGNVSTGYSNTAYSASQASCGSSCSSLAESRTCTNGTLSGSYTYTSCSVASPTWSDVISSFCQLAENLLPSPVCSGYSKGTACSPVNYQCYIAGGGGCSFMGQGYIKVNVVKCLCQ